MLQHIQESFAQNKEPSIEEIKKARAFELARKIQKIKKKIQEGKLTRQELTEALQEVKKLAEEITRIFKEKKGKELWDWETKKKLLTDDYINNEFINCGSPVFSSDGEKIAIWVRNGQGHTIAVNGQTWKERFDWCSDPVFSPDGKRIMVIVLKGKKYYRIVREI
jgi:hypothetical protein